MRESEARVEARERRSALEQPALGVTASHDPAKETTGGE
jgi:hypothetical protein